MNVKEANLVVEALKNEVNMLRLNRDSIKKNLDAFKPIFEAGAATEDDRKESSRLEERMDDNLWRSQTLLRIIDTIEEEDFTVRL